MQLYKRMHKHLPAQRNSVPQKEMGAEEERRDGFCVQEQWGAEWQRPYLYMEPSVHMLG